eukprot:scaffold60610_cov69-Phaeocystis_antarctica.AAC.3
MGGLRWTGWSDTDVWWGNRGRSGARGATLPTPCAAATQQRRRACGNETGSVAIVDTQADLRICM